MTMATAPRPGIDADEKMRAMLEAPLNITSSGRDLTMRVGDIAGDVEQECVKGGGYPGLTCIGLVAAGQIDLALLASLRFYAEKQAAVEVTFETIKAETTYMQMLNFVPPEIPEADAVLEVSEDPTPGA